MTDIKSFQFSKENFLELKKYQYGTNWPVVYVSTNEKEVYVGETINVYSRSKQHYENADRRRLNKIHVITDDEFNKSATLDIESWLIQYMVADKKYALQNSNGGLKNHNYYDREKYRAKFELIWSELMKIGLAESTISKLENSDLFKYSPYKALSEDQMFISQQIIGKLIEKVEETIIINGEPGSGKTILASYLIKQLCENAKTKHLKIGFVVPMTSLRKTLKNVFRSINGLKSSMVIGPSDVTKEKYDLLIVDEAHRLKRRKNITNYKSHDDINRKLGLSNEGTELDWILKSSNAQIFFYDKNQSVRPSDIPETIFEDLEAVRYTLSTQMRVKGGEAYIRAISGLLELNEAKIDGFDNYDFKLFTDISQMRKAIKDKNSKVGLSRLVAGYAWPWHTKNKKEAKQDFDIEIDGIKFVWNSTAQDWVNSANAINEVGCIHTVQGYDLNYVGVIIGPEFTYSKESNKFVVDDKQYFDANGRNGITDPKELERYLVNIYKTLLTRGIYGTYVYIVDKELREYFESKII